MDGDGRRLGRTRCKVRKDGQREGEKAQSVLDNSGQSGLGEVKVEKTVKTN